MFFVLLSCDSLIILSNRCSFVKHFFYFFELCFKFSVSRQLVYSIKMFFICQELFCFLLHICFKAKESAGGGIRTHAPLRTNGFQDRLVMTTSIPLHIYNSENRLIELPLCNVRYDITCTFPMSRPYFIFYRFFCFFP